MTKISRKCSILILYRDLKEKRKDRLKTLFFSFLTGSSEILFFFFLKNTQKKEDQTFEGHNIIETYFLSTSICVRLNLVHVQKIPSTLILHNQKCKSNSIFISSYLFGALQYKAFRLYDYFSTIRIK